MTTVGQTRDDTRRGLIPEDLLKFRWLEEIAIDPTARHVAYTVKRPDAAANGYVVDVYVRALEGSDARRLTHAAGSASSLAWSRDGRRLAYSWSEANRESVQVWNVAADQPTNYPVVGYPLSALDWSPDGRHLVGVRWTRMQHADDGGPHPGVPAPTIRVIRRLRYKLDGAGFVANRYTQIWVLDLLSGELTQITDSECDYSEPKWSQKGDRLAFTGTAREQNTELGQGQIFICDFPDGRPRPLCPQWVGACRSPVWGNDDRHIAFAGHTSPAPTNRRIFMMPYLADVEEGTARPLTPDLDQEVGNYAVADQRKGLANVTLKWPTGDPWIYFLLTEQGATHLYRINGDGQSERITDGPSITFDYSPAPGNVAAYGLADPSTPGDVYLWRNDNRERLTALNPWLRDHHLAAPEEYWYDGLDGAKVHAWIVRPPAFDERCTYPAIVYVHCSMFSWDFNHEVQCYASAGFVVAYFNQRGTTAGYGQAWTLASQGDQGGREYEEIMLGVDDLVRRRYVDRDRLGVTGGSCGGFLTNWIVGHTDRFAAAVTQRSIANYISFFGTSDFGPEYTERDAGASAWTDLAATWRQSPIAYAANIKTPLLIVHSDQDYRCPLAQAEELFAALRWMGREVELVVFEGENHDLALAGRPGNRIERLRRILGWFQKHLGTQPG